MDTKIEGTHTPGPRVFLVVYRTKDGCSQMHPDSMGYMDAKRLVNKRYPRTGIIYTACRIFEVA